MLLGSLYTSDFCMISVYEEMPIGKTHMRNCSVQFSVKAMFSVLVLISYDRGWTLLIFVVDDFFSSVCLTSKF